MVRRFVSVTPYELGNAGATASFQLDSPDPKALFENPIIPAIQAAKDHEEQSQFVQLEGGAPYHFTLDFFQSGDERRQPARSRGEPCKGSPQPNRPPFPAKDRGLYPRQGPVIEGHAVPAKDGHRQAGNQLPDRSLRTIQRPQIEFATTQASDDTLLRLRPGRRSA